MQMTVFACFPGQEESYLSMLRQYDLEGRITFSTEELPTAKENSARFSWTLPYIGIVIHGSDDDVNEVYMSFHHMCLGYSFCLHSLGREPYHKNNS